MHTMSITKMKDFLFHVAVRNRRSVMIWGEPGCGKSQGSAQLVRWLDEQLKTGGFATRKTEWFAKFRGAVMCDIRLGQYDSVDLRGLPDREGDMTRWLMPETLPFIGNDKFSSDDLVVVFFDEINSCSQAVFAASMQMLAEHRLGEHRFGDNVVIICAGNRESDRGVANRMPTTVANRMTHIEAGPDKDAMTAYAAEKGWPPILIAFWHFRETLLSTFDPKSPSKAQATPRTWEMVADYLRDEQMPEEVRQAAIEGSIGEGPAAEFKAFVDIWQKVAGFKAKVLKDPMSVDVPTEPSMRYALTVLLSGAIEDTTATAIQTFYKRMPPEFMVLGWQLALQRDVTLNTTPEFIEFSRVYRSAFSGA